MKPTTVSFLLVVLFTSNLRSQDAQRQIFVIPQLIDGLRYVVYESNAYNESTHLLKVYEVNDKDSALIQESYGLWDNKNKKFVYNGNTVKYDKNKKIKEKTYYLSNHQHEKHPSLSGVGWHTGNVYVSIPLLDYTPPASKSENSDLRLIAESSMISSATENCIAYNWLDNSINKSSDCTEKLTWWLPDLQLSQDDNYTKVLGFEFEMIFVAETSSELYPIQIMLGNGPKGFYYLAIDNEGKIYLGLNNQSLNSIDRLIISKATRISWGKENHIYLQLLENGEYYLEVNDYKFSSYIYEQKNKINNVNEEITLGDILGISNRMVIRNNIKMEYISLRMLEFLDDNKVANPYNGFHQNILEGLTDIIARTMLSQMDGLQILATDHYLMSFRDYSSKNAQHVATNITYNYNGKTTTKTLWTTYSLDKKYNAISKILLNTGIETAEMDLNLLYKELQKEKSINYRIENGMLFTPNSRR